MVEYWMKIETGLDYKSDKGPFLISGRFELIYFSKFFIN